MVHLVVAGSGGAARERHPHPVERRLARLLAWSLLVHAVVLATLLALPARPNLSGGSEAEPVELVLAPAQDRALAPTSTPAELAPAPQSELSPAPALEPAETPIPAGTTTPDPVIPDPAPVLAPLPAPAPDLSPAPEQTRPVPAPESLRPVAPSHPMQPAGKPVLRTPRARAAASSTPPGRRAAEEAAPLSEPSAAAPTPAPMPLIPPRPVAGMESNRPPAYPEGLRRRGVTGRVAVRVEVSAEGRPLSVTVAQSSGFTAMDQAALSAVQEWRFVPATQGGRPVAASASVVINFALLSE